MKTTMILLGAASIYIAGCTQNPSHMLKDDVMKKQIFSIILSDDKLSSELMDSMLMEHHSHVMAKMDSVMIIDPTVRVHLIGQVITLCNTDSSSCKMMMSEMMDMCQANQSKSDMMMNEAKARPKVMQSMQNMCNMNDMKGKPEEKKEEHPQHHIN